MLLDAKLNANSPDFLIMGQLMITVQEIKKKLKILSTNRDIRKVILFGSYAKSDASPKSDIDLVVIINTNKRFFDRYDLCDIFYDFFNVPVDILPYTEEEFKRISHRKFIRMIIREGIVVYESEKN